MKSLHPTKSLALAELMRFAPKQFMHGPPIFSLAPKIRHHADERRNAGPIGAIPG